VASWPGGARGALCLSFDNLGEAAELELGALGADTPLSADATLGRHFTVTRVLPTLLDALGGRDLAATFFVEGLNTELYSDALGAIAAGGHEIAYHAWRHEQWGDLSAEEQADNLARGIAAFRGLDGGAGVELAGMRPPGGQLGAGGLGVLREAGLRYCSPAGEGAGVEDGIALVPFQWQHVDATCVLPPLAPVRERMTGSPDPLDPGAFLAHLEREIERLSREGGFATIVLHLFMLDWLGEERLGALLDLVHEVKSRGDLWVAPCGRVADHVLAHPDEFRDGTTLDPTGWSG
jgi:peptidoglycan/xylan/chitin deacetylase (PgdA/CDA1 family)